MSLPRVSAVTELCLEARRRSIVKAEQLTCYFDRSSVALELYGKHL